LKVGITGQNGFIGWHLCYTLKYSYATKFQLIPFERNYFSNSDTLDDFVLKCDCIIHLAGLNRAEEENEIREINLSLSEKLAASFKRINFKGKLIFSSSSQEKNISAYGKSKKEAREVLFKASKKIGFQFIGLIIPNVFGPFCKPNYNSFIATFCHQIINNIEPKIIVNQEVELIYVSHLVEKIIESIHTPSNQNYIIPSQQIIHVSEVKKLLESYYNLYIKNGEIPSLETTFHINLFNTFRSYLKHEARFPVGHKKNSDNRGNFSEIIKCHSGGQFSYSTTESKATRGNHFHTRKIERFSVIQGEALIKLRKIGSKITHNFKLNGASPSFVDMPIWFAHSITNIGSEPLITLFWINEIYNEKDPDTYFEIVQA